MSRWAIRGAMAIAVVVLALVLLDSGGNQYTVKFALADALGLRNGSKVVEGGVQVGTVDVALNHAGNVVATATIDHQYAPLGRDTTAQVTALNLLGEKSLQLNPGNRHDALPSGTVLPSSRVTPGTDLDQVLDVLDPSTADRLTILVNEAGAAVAGRKADLGAILTELPNTAVQATALIRQLSNNNNSLSDLVANTDRVITALNNKHAQLGALIDTFGQSAKTVEVRDADLQSTLRELPGTLTTARGFLADLKTTTGPLGPAALDIAKVAPGLDSVLSELAPFTRAAEPTLARAESVAPELTELGDRATPVLRAAVPTLAALRSTSTDLKPVSAALDKSVDNVIGVMWNWTNAIEERDGLSHVFRAEVGITDQTVETIVNRLLANTGSSSSASSTRSHHPAAGGSRPAATNPLSSTVNHAGSGVAGTLHNLAGVISKTLNGVSQTVGGVTSGVSHTLSTLGAGTSSTLHNLAGALNHGAGSRSSGRASGTTSTSSTQQLSALLKYLL